MANAKKISWFHTATGATLYAIIRRDADNYRLDDGTGSFASAPADPYRSLTEDGVVKGLHEVSENRAAWNDGRYDAFIYKQNGGSPAPVSDSMLGRQALVVINDVQTVLWQATS